MLIPWGETAKSSSYFSLLTILTDAAGDKDQFRDSSPLFTIIIVDAVASYFLHYELAGRQSYA
jgi:hypothetical protein